jgi:DNA adenine methylase
MGTGADRRGDPALAARTRDPLLKWAGGKRWLVPVLRPLLAPYGRDRRFYEPFAGGMAVALGTDFQRVLVNDLNAHLMQFYRQVQAGLVIPPAVQLENDAAVYYRQRERFNQLLGQGRAALAGLTPAEAAEQAGLFYYLNKTGFNGLCRFNRKGEFNVPFGKYRTINYRRDFADYGRRLRRWELIQGDFQLGFLEWETVIYADPPYDAVYDGYTGAGFSWDDQVRLAEWLARHPGPVFASNAATERIQLLYRALGFVLIFLDGPRRISCDGQRDPAREILAVRP